MAIVNYQCDRCKRTIQIPQNTRGLEVMGKCIITESCHGNLLFESILQSYKTGQPPPIVQGLQDWQPRKVLYTHYQALKNTIWKVQHNLGVNPSVKVYVLNGEELVETEPLSIVYVNPNNLNIQFANQVEGIAQCIARTTAPLSSQVTTVEEPVQKTYLTANGILTIAVPELTSDVTMVIQFLSASTSLPLVSVNLTFGALPSGLSPWGDISTISIAGLVYKVKTVDIQAIINSLSIPDSTPFYFVSAAVVTPPSVLSLDDVLILLGNSPFTTVDKNLVQLVNASNVASVDVATLTSEIEGDLYVDPSLVQQTYPPIKYTPL